MLVSEVVATEFHGKKVADKPWSYLLVPEDVVLKNSTVKGLISTHTEAVGADIVDRYDLSE